LAACVILNGAWDRAYVKNFLKIVIDVREPAFYNRVPDRRFIALSVICLTFVIFYTIVMIEKPVHGDMVCIMAQLIVWFTGAIETIHWKERRPYENV